METATGTSIDWKVVMHELGNTFETRAAKHDEDCSFVTENYEALKSYSAFSAMIPRELDGGGVSHSEMCNLIRIMAKYCSSTALAFSMHQHLIAAAIWRFRNKRESGPMLEKVAKQQLVLVSTGARDWLDSNGDMIKTENGYLFSGKKYFASQSAAGDVAVTSAPYHHPGHGWQVLHFSVPLKADGVSLLDDWHVMSMRGTGSQTIVFDNVFIPDNAISLTRPRNGFHPVWDVVLTVAMPLIMSTYVGIAEKAMEIAMSIGRKYERNQKHLPYIIGRTNNTLIAATTQWKAMVALADNIDFKPSQRLTIDMLSLKTNVATACMQSVQECMEAIGGQSIYEKNNLERLFRDVQAAQFHPLPAWEQYQFTGERLLADTPGD